ncbi:hypothetical protein JAB1_44330 [Janthinobacterium sp. MP5059B]|uniref:DUF262 domain-containing protein n=1 Tax=Janthinobacterium sp. MP5059B TaxID=1766683 RepID=UPI000893D7D8|nr:DUF262 domain-containing protein [Janthinobacterium sp. MP5059B]OEZ48013.1 hypothetical protein JAB1_44330 [Janthinobacterium sp. MP5059B]
MFKVEPYEERNLRWWYEQYLSGRIDMAPPYQRKSEIWSKWKRAHLIDSILNDFDVPKFYVATSVEHHSARMKKQTKALSIIDGKQRMQAIFDFFADEVPLNASFVLDGHPDLNMAGLKYSQVSTKAAWLVEKIQNFTPSVMNVLTDEPHKIEELFVRLNSGEAANGSERRNAMKGPIPPILRDLVLHPFFQRKIKFGTQRMQEHNLAAKLLLIELREGFVDTKSKNLNDLAESAAKWEEDNPGKVNTEIDPYARARDKVIQVLDLLAKEFNDKDPLLASQGSIPIYYWVAREMPKKVNELRDFIEEFTKEVKEAFNVQKIDPAAADPELVSYYTMSRTTNDQASLEGRYKLLMRHFIKYRDPNSIKRR